MARKGSWHIVHLKCHVIGYFQETGHAALDAKVKFVLSARHMEESRPRPEEANSPAAVKTYAELLSGIEDLTFSDSVGHFSRHQTYTDRRAELIGLTDLLEESDAKRPFLADKEVRSAKFFKVVCKGVLGIIPTGHDRVLFLWPALRHIKTGDLCA